MFYAKAMASSISKALLILVQVKVDMGQPILLAPDVPTRLPANHKGAVVRAEILVDGIGWNVTCVSMGNPHCVTFSTKQGEVMLLEEIIASLFVISVI